MTAFNYHRKKYQVYSLPPESGTRAREEIVALADFLLRCIAHRKGKLTPVEMAAFRERMAELEWLFARFIEAKNNNARAIVNA